ncbi:cytoskeleton-associated protein 2-like isoform X2 [Nerophis lumbriciformis]|uniref:cytoskeleton-associated protein 2-like isoform X2 n=1 Tax=Nerophis lumbriciformis TaxID=546530 RepID=UPI002ADFA688|nr:cytoskeleton-associated protein 2-like isoform X2 [Nerophis lumbriciformis]
MDEEDPAASLTNRKELRKQKLMEYLTMKGKSKLPGSKPNVADGPVKKSEPARRPSSLQLIKGKENKAPISSFRQKDKNAQPLAPLAKQNSGRKTFVVRNKENLQSSIRTEPQKSRGSLSVCSTLAEKPAFRATYSLSSKPLLKADSHPTNQTNVRKPPTGKASSNANFSVMKNPKGSHRAATNIAASFPATAYTVRMSLGPMVKTRTGLISTMIIPRVSEPVRNQKSAPLRSRVSSSCPVSKIPLCQRPAVSCLTASKTQESRHKAILARQSQPPSFNLKSTFTTSSSRSAPHAQPTKQRPELEARKTSQRPNVHGGVATSRCVAKIDDKAPPAVARVEKPKTGRDTANKVADDSIKTAPKRRNAPAPRTATAISQPKAAAPKGRNAPAPRTATAISQPKAAAPKGRNAPAPRTATAISQPKAAPATKAPKSQTVDKKVTAEQEARMKKLQAWREAKGISYKRPPMTVKPPAKRAVALSEPSWTTMKAEDDSRLFVQAVDRSLSDCIKLLAESRQNRQVKEVLSRLPPVAQKFVKFWILKARLMEQEGDLDVLPMFEEAVNVVLEPVDELRTVVFDILKKKDKTQGGCDACEDDEKEECQTPSKVESAAESDDKHPIVTPPAPVRAHIWGEKTCSSVVKYKITVTPGGPLSQQKEPKQVNGQKVLFFTPVRRSVRIDRASLQYPPYLQEHDPCVGSFSDLLAAEEEEEEVDVEKESGGEASSKDGSLIYIYRDNEALKDKTVQKEQDTL